MSIFENVVPFSGIWTLCSDTFGGQDTYGGQTGPEVGDRDLAVISPGETRGEECGAQGGSYGAPRGGPSKGAKHREGKIRVPP